MTKDRGLSEDPVPDSLEADIGLRLRKLRKSRNLTISELASRAGVSAGAISQIERNLSNPTVRMLEQLRIVLNVPLTAFLENEEHDPRCGTLCQTIAGAPGFSCRKTGDRERIIVPERRPSVAIYDNRYSCTDKVG